MTREEAQKILTMWMVSSRGADGQRGYIEGWFDKDDVEAFRMAIEALSAEADRPTGEWIKYDFTYRTAICSQCEKVTMFEKWGDTVRFYNYCPNCGAKMGGKSHE